LKSNLLESHQKHKESQEERLKERSKSNFQTRNKTKLCDLKTKTQNICKINVKTDVYFVNIWKHDKAMVKDHV